MRISPSGIHWPITRWRKKYPNLPPAPAEIKNWYGYGQGVLRDEADYPMATDCTRLTKAQINQAKKTTHIHQSSHDERAGATDELWAAVSKRSSAKVITKSLGEGSTEELHAVSFTAPKIKKRKAGEDKDDSEDDPLDSIWGGTFASSSGGGGGGSAGPKKDKDAPPKVGNMNISKRDATLNASEALCLQASQAHRALACKPTMLTITADHLKKLKEY